LLAELGQWREKDGLGQSITTEMEPATAEYKISDEPSRNREFYAGGARRGVATWQSESP
jgi:hypothetical protein